MIKCRNGSLNNSSQSSKCPGANLTKLLLLKYTLFPVYAVNSNLIQVLPYTFNGASCYLLGNAGLFSFEI